MTEIEKKIREIISEVEHLQDSHLRFFDKFMSEVCMSHTKDIIERLKALQSPQPKDVERDIEEIIYELERRVMTNLDLCRGSFGEFGSSAIIKLYRLILPHITPSTEAKFMKILKKDIRPKSAKSYALKVKAKDIYKEPSTEEREKE